MKTNKIEEYGILTIGMCLVSVAFYFFMMPNKLLTGSMMGLAVVLGEVIALPVSVISMSLNIVCLLIGFLTVGREFGVKTIYASFITPAFLGLWEILFPNISSLTGELVIDIVFYILLGSIGQAMAFHVHASSGGTDIIAKVLNQYLHMDLGKAGAFTGIVIVASSLFIYDLRSMLIGILAAYINGLAVDEFIGGFTRKKKLCILSDKYEEIKDYIIYDLHRGVTLYPTIGGYNGKERMELVTILNKNEYGKIMEYMRRTDPGAFVTVTSISEVVGHWNTGKKYKR